MALILPLSALLTRRVSLRKSLTMAGAWIAIFVVGLLILGAMRELSGGGWTRITSLLRDDEQHIAGSTVRLRMAPDGHFWATVSINGVSRRMMIDSGATTTSLNLETAKAAGLDLAQNPFPVQIDTADGMIFARTSSVARLVLGPIRASDLRVVVAQEFGDMNVLGMNFLSRLQSWRVEDRTLILQPRNP
ncbi:retropepsin-like aspartic protease family protein [Sphingomonas crusticola]|uniref:retropepsin-like aspartic protease family protein n=1 Tax=Sphingomonas crusticola TaxID=1697973 RepID=UPI001F079AC1|nr:TIGR02281 family clan AA aspartic protease [Sphingomonas crusticola]